MVESAPRFPNTVVNGPVGRRRASTRRASLVPPAIRRCGTSGLDAMFNSQQGKSHFSSTFRMCVVSSKGHYGPVYGI